MFKTFLQRSDIPLNICLLLLMIGSFLPWNEKFRRASRTFILAGTFLILIFSIEIIPSFLLQPLEQKFPPLFSPGDLGSVASEISFVVVLGGEAQPVKNWPLTSQIGPTMLFRLTEGIRILNSLPQSRLVLSGGSRHQIPDAEIMKKLAVELGVSPNRMILETESTTTAEEALFLKEILLGKKFILVTSARHMPRAVSSFQNVGLDPIPAPTGHMMVPREEMKWYHLVPRSGNINLITHVFYEHLASLKAMLFHLKRGN